MKASDVFVPEPEPQSLPERRGVGRPSKYTKKLAHEICSRLAVGEALRAICRTPGMPTPKTIYNWAEKRPDFYAQMMRARHWQGHTVLDHAVEMVNDPASIGDPQVATVRLRAIMWLAPKLARSDWGDKTTVDLNHAGEVAVGFRPEDEAL